MIREREGQGEREREVHERSQKFLQPNFRSDISSFLPYAIGHTSLPGTLWGGTPQGCKYWRQGHWAILEASYHTDLAVLKLLKLSFGTYKLQERFYFILFFKRFYLFIRDRERERQRRRQREKQAPCREPNMGLNPRSPGSRPGLKAMLNCWATRAAQRQRILSRLCTECGTQRGAQYHELWDHDLSQNQELDT